MKKTINMFAAIIVSVAAIGIINARTISTKLPSTKQITSDTQNLKKAIKDVTIAKTIQQKKIAKKNVVETAEELLKNLEKRSIMSDLISGYTETQRKSAKEKLVGLYPLQIKLKKRIRLLNSQLDVVTKEGLGFQKSPAPGKEKLYEAFTKELDKLNDILIKVNRATRNQEVIVGKAWSNAFRTLVLASLLGIDLAFFGGTTTGIAALKSGLTLASGMTFATSLLSLQSQLNLATMAANEAKNLYNLVTIDPNAKPEDIARAEREKDRTHAEKEKLEKQLQAKQK